MGDAIVKSMEDSPQDKARERFDMKGRRGGELEEEQGKSCYIWEGGRTTR